MILKEAYRYQNYLSNILGEARALLFKGDFVTSTAMHELRSIATSGKVEDVFEQVEKKYEYTPKQVLDLCVQLIDEKRKLSRAIVDAKIEYDKYVDCDIATNREIEMLVSSLKNLDKTKPSTMKTEQTGYLFSDVDGKQYPYTYDVEVQISIDYDRNDIKGLLKKYRTMMDAASLANDEAKVLCDVKFTPSWEVGTPLDELLVPTDK